MNETIRTIEQRASLRRFAEQNILPEHRDILFNCAMRAHAAGNQMLYTMLDITDQKLKDKLVSYVTSNPLSQQHLWL